MTQAASNPSETFDYVIVGSGAAGAILANRLSEDGKATVCLLEAGSADWHPYIHIPAGFIKTLFNPAWTWQFQSEPSDMTNGRRIPLPQGRVLGGSTSVNGLVYNRGQRNDFDQWAQLGNAGWSYAEVLPYFKRTERRAGGDDRFRGRSGALPISDIAWIHPISEAFIAGAESLGMPRNPDYNGAEQAGVGYYQRTIQGRWRMSTSRTFLWPTRARSNLSIKTNAQAVQILLDGKRATGVRYMKNRQPASARDVLARREVIVCAGAINTPKLLQLSGIGPEALLREIGVPVRHHLPGVGANLSDHFSVRLVARVKNIGTMNEMASGLGLGGQIARWLLGRPNILALSPSLVHFFWKSKEGLTLPDLQGVFSPASYKEGYVGMLDSFPGMTAGVWQHRPDSRGYVHARSADVFADPLIQANYLQDPRDREVLVNGIRLARRLLQSPALAQYAECEALPGPDKVGDDELLDFARRYGVSSYHLNGTARMGPADDPMAVVDAQLRVHGLTGLRVADSSVMPSIPSANICAATMMIAEKAADMILGRAPLAAEELLPAE
ncbi:GMC family oxidoreductase [Noviherbaspirillum sedimenti]|uniref:Choline dehydrogenase n=1 Tax=Noviherbaspirillum sedimenti TaxID=2320865 RepID=A0A3A3GLB9_9BURK|nr:GMC family oxidoreductase N-terminal domain-containing protein [Noviherbaspirillum sedimenti]RJG03066.1 choline dehydrogenase [Noviherbaspirillum sedimenti]